MYACFHFFAQKKSYPSQGDRHAVRSGISDDITGASQGDRHAVRSGISDDGKPQTCQANKLSDACTILLGFVKYIIAALSTE